MQETWDVSNQNELSERVEQNTKDNNQAKLAYYDFVDKKEAAKIRRREARLRKVAANEAELKLKRQKDRIRARVLAEEREAKWGENKLDVQDDEAPDLAYKDNLVSMLAQAHAQSKRGVLDKVKDFVLWRKSNDIMAYDDMSDDDELYVKHRGKNFPRTKPSWLTCPFSHTVMMRRRLTNRHQRSRGKRLWCSAWIHCTNRRNLAF